MARIWPILFSCPPENITSLENLLYASYDETGKCDARWADCPEVSSRELRFWPEGAARKKTRRMPEWHSSRRRMGAAKNNDNSVYFSREQTFRNFWLHSCLWAVILWISWWAWRAQVGCSVGRLTNLLPEQQLPTCKNRSRCFTRLGQVSSRAPPNAPSQHGAATHPRPTAHFSGRGRQTCGVADERSCSWSAWSYGCQQTHRFALSLCWLYRVPGCHSVFEWHVIWHRQVKFEYLNFVILAVISLSCDGWHNTIALYHTITSQPLRLI